MTYTFAPKQRFAKASGTNMRISTKSAEVICRVIRKKPLKRAKRLLNDLAGQKRGLGVKYYSKTVKQILELLESCEKNAEFLGLENNRLFVHASAHQGTSIRRRRRKAAFGSAMKNTNMEIMLIERGKDTRKITSAKKTETDKQIEKEHAAAKSEIEELKVKTAELKEKVGAAK
ncbi:MAG: hypothetical protein HY514_04505 [Candidatus Aenigmarchaeota archaeon]|nr:hypothetical protein [Candidatus Aenigmarchaeota archaeon]